MSRARVSDIITIAARLSGIASEAITGPGRSRNITRVRQAVYYVARSNGHSYPQIGARVNRDHSTIVYGVDRAIDISQRDSEYASFLFNLIDEASRAGPFIPVPKRVAFLIEDLPEPPPMPRPKASDPTPIPAHQYFKRTVKPKNDFGDDQFIVGRARL